MDRKGFAVVSIILVAAAFISLILIWPVSLVDFLTNLSTEIIGILISLVLVGIYLDYRQREWRRRGNKLIESDLGWLSYQIITSILSGLRFPHLDHLEGLGRHLDELDDVTHRKIVDHARSRDRYKLQEKLVSLKRGQTALLAASLAEHRRDLIRLYELHSDRLEEDYIVLILEVNRMMRQLDRSIRTFPPSDEVFSALGFANDEKKEMLADKALAIAVGLEEIIEECSRLSIETRVVAQTE